MHALWPPKCSSDISTLHGRSSSGSTLLLLRLHYIEDILVASATPEEHLEHLRMVFERLEKYGLVINVTKSHFGVAELDFLGHHVDSTGIRPLEEKVRVIREFPQPVTQRKLQEFLGVVNFYRRFIPHCATTLQPLKDLLKHNHKPSDRLEWSDSATTAFSTIEEALANTSLLCHLPLMHLLALSLMHPVSQWVQSYSSMLTGSGSRSPSSQKR